MTRGIAKLPKPKAKRRPIYMRCELLVRAETGEQVRGWTSLTQWDARELKDRGYHVGDEVRVEMKKRRNVKFHRLAHAMGALMVEQHDEFAGSNAHDALKRLQTESGAACDLVEMNASPVVAAVLAAAQSLLGDAAAKMLTAVLPSIKTISVYQPRSMSFDELDEGEFQQVMATIYKHIRDRYYPTMELEAVEEMVLMYERGN